MGHATRITQTRTNACICAPDQLPEYVFGFADLKAWLGDVTGDALECEPPNPDNGDTLQRTTTRLAVYRKRTNTPTFTNGSEHWALTAQGPVTWSEDSIDPPGDRPASPLPIAPVPAPNAPVAAAAPAAIAQVAPALQPAPAQVEADRPGPVLAARVSLKGPFGPGQKPGQAVSGGIMVLNPSTNRLYVVGFAAGYERELVVYQD